MVNYLIPFMYFFYLTVMSATHELITYVCSGVYFFLWSDVQSLFFVPLSLQARDGPSVCMTFFSESKYAIANITTGSVSVCVYM